MFEEALRKVKEKGGTLWSLGERERGGGTEWYASIHISSAGKTFCASGIAATPERAIEEALSMALRPLPSATEVQAQFTKKSSTLNLPGPTIKINL